MEAGALPLRPGEPHPLPAQRGLDEVEAVPTITLNCPACGHPVLVDDVAKLMRRTGGDNATATPWRLDAADRDADLCPYPGKDKIAYRADIVVCPQCGFTEKAGDFSRPVPPTTAAWVRDVLRPSLRDLQYSLLGRRGNEMTETEVVEFFNRQQEIPDPLRTEHARIYTLASARPRLEQAEATWDAPFALRRAMIAPPQGAFLARRHANVMAALDKVKRAKPGLAGDIDALRGLIRGTSSRERLNAADRMAARLHLAGLKLRQGLGREAAADLAGLLDDCRERFARPEQDPLWQFVAPRSKRDFRLVELENIRLEMENEIKARLDFLHGEQEHLKDAARLIREAILDGECDRRPAECLFYAYLTGEFLRRTDSLPLAAEWFKNVIALAPADSPVRAAAEPQLALTGDQAGDRSSLLSALGQDGEIFTRIREICHGDK